MKKQIRIIKDQQRTFYEIRYMCDDGTWSTIEEDIISGGGKIVPFNEFTESQKKGILEIIKGRQEFWKSVEEDLKCQ